MDVLYSPRNAGIPVSRLSIRKGKLFLATAMLLPTVFCHTHAAEATATTRPIPGPVNFDLDVLKDRGLSAETAVFFASAPRFTPGSHVLAVALNGIELGKRPVDFDAAGIPCLSKALLESIGVSKTPDVAALFENGEACVNVAAKSARIEIMLQPSLNAIDITVAPEWVRQTRAPDIFRNGGVGGLLNYRAFRLDAINAGSRSVYQNLDIEAGLNIEDWLLRARQTMTETGGRRTTRLGTAYVQRNFMDGSRILQLGRFTTANILFGGIPLLGGQWLPERSLRRQDNFTLRGVAFGRSRVEIRQNGALLYTTYVPSGPFALTDYPIQNVNADLEMRIVDDGGAEQSTVVPATSLLLAADTGQPSGFAAAAGRIWRQSEVTGLEEMPVALFSYGFEPAPGMESTVGMLQANRYRSVSAAMSWRPNPVVSTFGQLTAADDEHDGRRGAIVSAALSVRASADLAVGFSSNLRSRQYRSLLEVASFGSGTLLYQGLRSQIGMNLFLTGGWAQGITASITRQDFFSDTSNYVFSLGWGTTIREISAQVGVSRSVTNSPGLGENQQRLAPLYAYLNFSIPLGGGARNNSYVRSNDGERLIGTSVDQTLNPYFGYRATVERQTRKDGPDVTTTSVSASVLPRYFGMTVGATEGPGRSSRFGEISGSVIVTTAGLALAPYAVQDSYGIAKVGNLSGVQVNTPMGPVWSGWRGLVAVPGMTPFRESLLEISTRSVPANANIDYGLIAVAASRGAVVNVDMGVRLVRRVLLSIRDAAGQPLPSGLGLLKDGQFVASIGSRGRVVVDLPEDPASWTVRLGDGKNCVLGPIQTAPRTDQTFFEIASAVCEES